MSSLFVVFSQLDERFVHTRIELVGPLLRSSDFNYIVNFTYKFTRF